MNEPRVLLATLSFRVSEKSGKTYCTGWLGKSRLIGFPGDLDRFGNKTIELYLRAVPETREQKPTRELLAVNDQ